MWQQRGGLRLGTGLHLLGLYAIKKTVISLTTDMSDATSIYINLFFLCVWSTLASWHDHVLTQHCSQSSILVLMPLTESQSRIDSYWLVSPGELGLQCKYIFAPVEINILYILASVSQNPPHSCVTAQLVLLHHSSLPVFFSCLQFLSALLSPLSLLHSLCLSSFLPPSILSLKA